MSKLLNALRFTLYSWRKLCYIRDLGDTEVSFFAVSRRDDPGLVIDVRMPYQTGSMAYTEFDEERLANFFEDMVDAGLHPEEFGRIWCHTHPGQSASPSGKDEDTFKEEFGATNWAIMFILGKGSNAQTTCRIKYRNHPELEHVLGTHVSKELDVEVDLEADCPAINQDARELWKQEYEERHTKRAYVHSGSNYNWHSSSGYNWNMQNNYTPSHNPHFIGWRTKAREKVFGPGWRKNSKGRWTYSVTQLEEDKKNNITVSPDFIHSDNAGASTPSSPSSEQWRQRFQSDERKTPIGFYQPETSSNGKLTKRERKYLKKHGTLAGFVPPQRKSPPNKDWDKLSEEEWVRTEKLETSRNLLYEQSDEEWLSEAADIYELARDDEYSAILPWDDLRISKAYTVTLEDGEKYDRVWARTPEEALFLVEKELNSEFSETVKKALKGKDVDTELELIKEPTDEELRKIEAELDAELALGNEIVVFGESASGLTTYSEHELAAAADTFHDGLFRT